MPASLSSPDMTRRSRSNATAGCWSPAPACLEIGDRLPAAVGHDLLVALDGSLQRADVAGTERGIAFGRACLPFPDELAIGDRRGVRVGTVYPSLIRVLRGRRCARREHSSKRNTLPRPHMARALCRKICPQIIEIEFGADGPPKRSQIPRAQAPCCGSDAEMQLTGATAPHRGQTAARPGAHKGRPGAAARRGGPPRRCGPCPAPGCGWRAARWPAGGR